MLAWLAAFACGGAFALLEEGHALAAGLPGYDNPSLEIVPAAARCNELLDSSLKEHIIPMFELRGSQGRIVVGALDDFSGILARFGVIPAAGGIEALDQLLKPRSARVIQPDGTLRDAVARMHEAGDNPCNLGLCVGVQGMQLSSPQPDLDPMGRLFYLPRYLLEVEAYGKPDKEEVRAFSEASQELIARCLATGQPCPSFLLVSAGFGSSLLTLNASVLTALLPMLMLHEVRHLVDLERWDEWGKLQVERGKVIDPVLSAHARVVNGKTEVDNAFLTVVNESLAYGATIETLEALDALGILDHFHNPTLYGILKYAVLRGGLQQVEKQAFDIVSKYSIYKQNFFSWGSEIAVRRDAELRR